MRRYLLIGVSGCGKSTVGPALSVVCGMDFVDGELGTEIDAARPSEHVVTASVEFQTETLS